MQHVRAHKRRWGGLDCAFKQAAARSTEVAARRTTAPERIGATSWAPSSAGVRPAPRALGWRRPASPRLPRRGLARSATVPDPSASPEASTGRQARAAFDRLRQPSLYLVVAILRDRQQRPPAGERRWQVRRHVPRPVGEQHDQLARLVQSTQPERRLQGRWPSEAHRLVRRQRSARATGQAAGDPSRPPLTVDPRPPSRAAWT